MFVLLQKRMKFSNGLTEDSYVEAHPMSGFSHRCCVSKDKVHFLMLCVPLCILLRDGKNMVALRV